MKLKYLGGEPQPSDAEFNDAVASLSRVIGGVAAFEVQHTVVIEALRELSLYRSEATLLAAARAYDNLAPAAMEIGEALRALARSDGVR